MSESGGDRRPAPRVNPARRDTIGTKRRSRNARDQPSNRFNPLKALKLPA